MLDTQVSRYARVQVNPNASTTTLRMRDFTRTNTSTFFGSKVEKDPQGFIDEVFKVVDVMGVTSQEKAELFAYQLKYIGLFWYEQWKDERPVREGQITRGLSKLLSLTGSFPWN